MFDERPVGSQAAQLHPALDALGNADDQVVALEIIRHVDDHAGRILSVCFDLEGGGDGVDA